MDKAKEAGQTIGETVSVWPGLGDPGNTSLIVWLQARQ
jgi:hypothetical protein